MSAQVFAIIPAAGQGSRMGLGRPKVLCELGGRTVLERTVALIQDSSNQSSHQIVHTVVLAPPECVDEFSSLLSDCESLTVVAGGETRKDSVSHGLAALQDHFVSSVESYVLIHDAARCLVSPDIIQRSVAGAVKHSAITVAVPVVDSLKRVDESRAVVDTVPRKGLWAVQTPQVFRTSLILEAHHQANLEATDDAALVEAIHPVHVVEGDRTNIKLTTPEDLALAAALMTP